MSIISRDTLKQWFSKGKYPTQSQFWSWIDAFWHKGDKLPISSVDGLTDALNSKVTTMEGFSLVSSEEKDVWNNKSDFSGSYNDLSDKPTIPSTEGFIKNEADAFSYDNLADKPTIPSIPGLVTQTTDGLMSSEDKVKLDATNKTSLIQSDGGDILLDMTNSFITVIETGSIDITLSAENTPTENNSCISIVIGHYNEDVVSLIIPSELNEVSVVNLSEDLSIEMSGGDVVELSLLYVCEPEEYGGNYYRLLVVD